MSVVRLRKDDTLELVYGCRVNTPMGMTDIEVVAPYTYDEALALLSKEYKFTKKRKTSTRGSKFSKHLALSVRAITSGKWSTGQAIDRDKVIEKLMIEFNTLSTDDYDDITEAGRNWISKLFFSNVCLTEDEIQLLQPLLNLEEV